MKKIKNKETQSETQLQRIVKKKRLGKFGGGSVHISLNGFNADKFFENKKELKEILKSFYEDSNNVFDMLMSLEVKKYDKRTNFTKSD